MEKQGREMKVHIVHDYKTAASLEGRYNLLERTLSWEDQEYCTKLNSGVKMCLYWREYDNHPNHSFIKSAIQNSLESMVVHLG
jgi:hypothetical protein